MCGIAGKFNLDPNQPVDGDRIDRMTTALVHRGPDGSGLYIGPGIGLGHRRLSIIDLATGAQPLSNENETIWVTFNGEIYNFAEIRHDLEQRGHAFKTHSDTEVIVHAYEEWGVESVQRFRGMFAYAIWDEPRRRLVLVRDRLGVKPLYFSATKEGITFGSELKAIVQDPAVSREWSPAALDAYLALQYIPTPHTIYRDVFKLPAGHYLIAERGDYSVHRYWDLTFTGEDTPASEDELLAELSTLVDESVALRLISDVPIGAFLSGGIDSSLVVASMAATSSGRVETASVGFSEERFNELGYARSVARHLDVRMHEHVVTPDITDLLPRLVWHFDEPFADSSAVPTFYVSKAARQHVTVALSGDGGDELWAGYARHHVEQWEARARTRLGSTASVLAGSVASLLPLTIKGVRSLRHLALTPDEACARKHAYGLFEHDERRGMYSGDFRAAVRHLDPLTTLSAAYRACASTDPVDRALYVDVKTYLTDDIMTKVDRMSMAVSLEAREPLLDHRLLEFAARVPSRLKLRNGRGKHLLRRVLAQRVPERLIDRPKQGFAVPVGDWLRGPLAPLVEDLVLDRRFGARGIFDQRRVASLWAEHRSRATDHGHRLWSLVMLELWFRQFSDGSATGFTNNKRREGVAA